MIRIFFPLFCACTCLMVACGSQFSETDSVALTASDGAEEPAAVQQPASPACALLPDDIVVASAPWGEAGLQLVIGGDSVARGQSDREFEVIDAELRLVNAKDSCLLSRVPLGELSRVIPDENDGKQIGVLELNIQPLGQMQGLIEAAAFERATIPGLAPVLLVHLMRDVEWGLTERYAVPITVNEPELIAGDRVQVGRDGLSPPVYYGEFEVDLSDAESPLLLLRHGNGRFSKRVQFSPDSAGALRAIEEPVLHPTVPGEAADGSDMNRPRRECGAESAAYVLAQEACPDGSKPDVKRAGNAGMADDGHIIDRFLVTCGTDSQESQKIVHVDAFHCIRKSSNQN